MWTTKFWKQTGERAIKTFAQALSAMLVGDNIGLLEVDWVTAISVAALTTLASVLTSIASVPIGEDDSPNITN